MSVIHFDPYFYENDELPEKTPCGVFTPESEYLSTGDFSQTTCKRCLKMKNRLVEQYNQQEKHIINQMGDFVDFITSKN